MNILVTTISERLRLDPMNGKTFAFCDAGRSHISTIFWDGKMFRIGKYPKAHGDFVWPNFSWGAIITVRESEFETLLSYAKKRSKLGRKTL